MHSETITVPRRLIREVMKELDQTFGARTEKLNVKLAAADLALERSERELYRTPRGEWPEREAWHRARVFSVTAETGARTDWEGRCCLREKQLRNPG
jgi:hypothetical protein